MHQRDRGYRQGEVRGGQSRETPAYEKNKRHRYIHAISVLLLLLIGIILLCVIQAGCTEPDRAYLYLLRMASSHDSSKTLRIGYRHICYSEEVDIIKAATVTTCFSLNSENMNLTSIPEEFHPMYETGRDLAAHAFAWPLELTAMIVFGFSIVSALLLLREAQTKWRLNIAIAILVLLMASAVFQGLALMAFYWSTKIVVWMAGEADAPYSFERGQLMMNLHVVMAIWPVVCLLAT